MRLLSFDTSQIKLNVCLFENGRTVASETHEASANNRQEVAGRLLPIVDALMAKSNWTKSSLDLIVVGIGPGSFTGLRAGIVTARTAAQALNVGLVGISQFDSFYFQMGKDGLLPAGVVISAGTNKGVMHFYGAGFADGVEAVEPAYFSFEDLQSKLGAFDTWFVEPALQPLFNGRNIKPLPVIENIAIIQAQVAMYRLSLKGIDGSQLLDTEQRKQVSNEFPWTAVTPLYLRGASITVKAKDGN